MRISRKLSTLSAGERRKVLKCLKLQLTWDAMRFDPIGGFPVSIDPHPDVFFGLEHREDFLTALAGVCSSAVWQLQGRGGYGDSARLNRERIAKDAARAELEAKAAAKLKTKSRKRAA